MNKCKFITRRNVLVAGAGGAASVLSGCTVARQPLQDDVSSAERVKLGRGFKDFAAYFRLMSDFGGESTYRYQYGRVLVVPAPRQMAQDFVDFVSIKQDRTRRLGNGDFHHAYKGITLFTDKDTGDVLQTLENPFTGEMNTVEHFATSGGSIVYTPEGTYLLRPGADPDVTPTLGSPPARLDWAVAGDYAWLTYPERFEIREKNGTLVGSD